MAKLIGVHPQGSSSFRINYRDRDGNRFFETVECETAEEAANVRAVRLGDIARGLPVNSKSNVVLFEELAADMLSDYAMNRYSSFEDQDRRFRLHVLPVFGKRKAAQITTAQLKHYRIRRRDDGAKDASINRELEAMRHAFHLGRACTPPKVLFVPVFPILKEHNVRTGFFERIQLEALCLHLPAHLIAPVRLAYITGWRFREVFDLCWRHVHVDGIRLEPGETKNREGRTFPMVTDLEVLLERIRPTKFFPGDKLFTREGQNIGRFDKAWSTACRKAGLPVRHVPLRNAGKQILVYKRGKNKGKPILACKANALFHDFRRTAYRNLVRLGIPEKVARAAVGWLDPKTADRYNIVAKADLDAIRERYNAASGATFGANRTKDGAG